MNMLRNVDGNIIPISFSGGGGGYGMGPNIGISSWPTMLDLSQGTFLERNYDLLAGEQPQSPIDLVLVVDNQNRIPYGTLNALGFSTESLSAISFDEIIGTEFQLIGNDDYFIETEFGTFIPNRDFENMYNSPNNITLTIVGIVRQQLGANLAMLSPGIAYSDDLSTMIINMAMDSQIVQAQREADFNVISREPLTDEARQTMISFLGGNANPMMMMIYPQGFSEKDVVISLLDEFNAGRADEDMILYTDLAAVFVGMVGGIIDGITLVLIAFAATSLIVSFIMIAIITYISVLERTKEIGILKALGARKKDITRVFNAETFIIGAFSGTLGIVIAVLATIPINNVIYRMTDMYGVANLQILHALGLLTLSVTLTMLGGWIPAKMASKKDAVEALRTD
jgi:putative ABC transport system permease protein